MSLPDSYPPATYHGDNVEVSAWIRRADAPPELTYGNGVTCDYIMTGRQSAGRFGLYRWTFGDTESGPDPHFHRSLAESFCVLSGEVRLFDGNRWVTAGSGDYLHVPDGGLHGFKGRDRASMLLMFSPGAPREDYFETLDRLGRGLTMTEEERAAFMLRHDTFWVD